MLTVPCKYTPNGSIVNKLTQVNAGLPSHLRCPLTIVLKTFLNWKIAFIIAY